MNAVSLSQERSGRERRAQKVPHAWIVLSAAGKKRGTAVTIKAFEAWTQESPSWYKWLRDGVEVVKVVRVCMCFNLAWGHGDTQRDAAGAARADEQGS